MILGHIPTPETDKSVRSLEIWDAPTCQHVIIEYVCVHKAKDLERRLSVAESQTKTLNAKLTVVMLHNEELGKLAYANACEAMEYRKKLTVAREALTRIEKNEFRADFPESNVNKMMICSREALTQTTPK